MLISAQTTRTPYAEMGVSTVTFDTGFYEHPPQQP